MKKIARFILQYFGGLALLLLMLGVVVTHFNLLNALIFLLMLVCVYIILYLERIGR